LENNSIPYLNSPTSCPPLSPVRVIVQVCMPHDGTPLVIRIGLHTGPCMSGLIGTKLPKFSLFGDTMNTVRACGLQTIRWFADKIRLCADEPQSRHMHRNMKLCACCPISWKGVSNPAIDPGSLILYVYLYCSLSPHNYLKQ
jgi:class 3 adenylate cyclase